MFEELRNSYQQTTGVPLTISDDDIKSSILFNPELGQAMVDAGDAGLPDFLRANAPAIIALLQTGATADPGPADVPGVTPGQKKAKNVVEPSEDFKSLTKSQAALVERKYTENLPERERNSRSAHITGVIISKPCPSEWMKNVPPCLPNTKTTSYTELKAFDPAGADAQTSILTWMQNNPSDKAIIPTSAQLIELAAEHKRRWDASQAGKTSKSGKTATYKAPDWANGGSQDANLAAIQGLLGSADGKFDVLVATPDGDPNVGAKPWHWVTRGFEIEVQGEDGAVSTLMTTTNGLTDFLMTKTVGYISPAVENGLAARLTNYRPRSKNGETQKAVVRSRVTNNRPGKDGKGPKLIPAMAPNYEKTVKSGQKSTLYYYVLRTVANKSGENTSEVQYRVTRRRVSLIWDGAPSFAGIPEVLDRVDGPLKGVNDPRTKSINRAKKQDFETLIRNALAGAMTADSNDDLTGIQKTLRAEGQQALAADAAAEAAAMA